MTHSYRLPARALGVSFTRFVARFLQLVDIRFSRVACGAQTSRIRWRSAVKRPPAAEDAGCRNAKWSSLSSRKWSLFLARCRSSMRMLVAGVAVLPLTALCAADSAQYPENFRHWLHVHTAVLMPGANPQLKSEEGMRHIFANEQAVRGYASGDFADGSIIVYELREIRQQHNGVIFEGERKRVDVMIKDSALKKTGGWRFERFWGNDQAQDALHDSGAACFECHSKAQAHGSVYSELQ